MIFSWWGMKMCFIIYCNLSEHRRCCPVTHKNAQWKRNSCCHFSSWVIPWKSTYHFCAADACRVRQCRRSSSMQTRACHKSTIILNQVDNDLQCKQHLDCMASSRSFPVHKNANELWKSIEEKSWVTQSIKIEINSHFYACSFLVLLIMGSVNTHWKQNKQ